MILMMLMNMLMMLTDADSADVDADSADAVPNGKERWSYTSGQTIHFCCC